MMCSIVKTGPVLFEAGNTVQLVHLNALIVLISAQTLPDKKKRWLLLS